MSAKIIISIAGGWVLKHREDEVLPTEFLKQELQKQFNDNFTVISSNLTELVFSFTGEFEPIPNKIKEIFAAHYNLDINNEILSIRLDSDNEEKSNDLPNIDANVKVEPSIKTADDYLEQINDLVGGDEFKSLAKELKDISAQIVQNKTFDVFSYQSYIFSINDGYGLSKYLSLFASLLSSLKIKNVSSNNAVVEVKLPAPKGDSEDPFSDVKRILCRSNDDEIRLLCIDISEWMNELHSRLFKGFLMSVERQMSGFIVIFRIPFVDKEILDKVKYFINDLMFVRSVAFPPFTEQEIQKCAKIELENYGFNMSNSAWLGFNERIAEEKSDGKFYGLNTVKKVVRELLYKKQLKNAKNGKDNFLITKKDTLMLCANGRDLGLSGYAMLDKLVGGEKLKQRINEIVAQIELAKNNPNVEAPCIHMRFVGNPGTGKTTVARIVGKILKEKGVLRIGNFYEYSGRDFCGRYIGETAPKTASMCRDAYGSVLFIDEAYSLYRGDDNNRDYGREALDTLIAEMENHRSDLVVIMAGYTDDMDKLMKGNAGLVSRMPYVIEFPNFTKEQLYDIFVSMVKQQFKYNDELLSVAHEYFDKLPDEVVNAKEFSNARFVRNLFERTWSKASMRCQLLGIKNITLTKDDFERSISDKEFTFIMKKKNKIGFGE